MPRPVRPLSISTEQRRALRLMINRPSAPYRDNRRAWIILHRAEGLSQMAAARKLGVSRPVVIQWEQRFRKAGLAGLADSKGRGRRSRFNYLLSRQDPQFDLATINDERDACESLRP